MDRGGKDKVQGEAKDIKGRIERQSGEWSGDKAAQAEGAAEQATGKAQKAIGKAKEKLQAMKDKRRKPGDQDLAA